MSVPYPFFCIGGKGTCHQRYIDFAASDTGRGECTLVCDADYQIFSGNLCCDENQSVIIVTDNSKNSFISGLNHLF